ncbi:MAG: SAM-dependent methyltransferase [Gammaproteobacteria bacterium]|nr:SAM-dependent methyltransferase [Gammaproteobacteria bacterium]
MTTPISNDVLTVLSTVEINGCDVEITAQLQRPLYNKVNEVLDRIGGKWNRKAKAHVFPDDPTEKLNAVIECGVLEPKIKTGYFPTPPALVARMIELADLSIVDLILEPSAGQGHIADEICTTLDIEHDSIDVCEILHDNVNILKVKGYDVFGDFHDHALRMLEGGGTYDKILMNPPFERQQDIDHVGSAFNLLDEGGKLVAIMSSGVMFRENKKTKHFRDNILCHATLIEDNPRGSFKESGTMVNTVMIVLEK